MIIENPEIEAIKKYLKEHKISYLTLSEKSGIPIGSLRNIFSGISKNPRLDTIQAILRALDLPEQRIDATLATTYLTLEEEEIIETFRSLTSERDKTLFLLFVRNMQPASFAKKYKKPDETHRA